MFNCNIGKPITSIMNLNLWTAALQFNFDDPVSECGFSLRLADENRWTKDFTQKAIIEHKKFMYLAAVSEQMVSPSEIIDIVWHQHLIFTQSYTRFCGLLGKNIQHIPSTHNKEEFEKFKQAKARTNQLYFDTFGDQPQDIWECTGMFNALLLPKAAYNIRTFVLVGILVITILIIPAYFILKPMYVHINNPYFIPSYVLLTVVAFVLLEIYNRSYLNNIVSGLNAYAFIYNLQPAELVYLKTQSLKAVIHGCVSKLVQENKIVVNNDRTIQLKTAGNLPGAEDYTIIETLKDFKTIDYGILVKLLLAKPVFRNVAATMDAFKKYFNQSKAFGKLFHLNFTVSSLVILPGVIRLFTGIMRDKPVGQLLPVLIFSIIIAYAFLVRLSNMFCVYTIPNFYKTQVLPAGQQAGTADWQYFLYGNAVLPADLIPVINYTKKTGTTNSGGTSCGSSCGSGCGGSSCGGCGGH